MIKILIVQQGWLTEGDDDVRVNQPDLLQQQWKVELHLFGGRGSVVKRPSAGDVAGRTQRRQ